MSLLPIALFQAHGISPGPPRLPPNKPSLTERFAIVIREAYTRFDNPIDLKNRTEVTKQALEAIESFDKLRKLRRQLKRAIENIQASPAPPSKTHLSTLQDHHKEVIAAQHLLYLKVWRLHQLLDERANRTKPFPALLLIPKENARKEGEEQKSSPPPAAAPAKRGTPPRHNGRMCTLGMLCSSWKS